MKHTMTMSISECPFCGGKAHVWHSNEEDRDGTTNFAFVKCHACGAQGQVAFYYKEEDRGQAEAQAILSWNRRFVKEKDD